MILVRSALLNLSTPLTCSLPVFLLIQTRDPSSALASSSSFGSSGFGFAVAVLVGAGRLAPSRAVVVGLVRAVEVVVVVRVRVVRNGAVTRGFVTIGATRETPAAWPAAPRPRLRRAFCSDLRAAALDAVGRM